MSCSESLSLQVVLLEWCEELKIRGVGGRGSTLKKNPFVIKMFFFSLEWLHSTVLCFTTPHWVCYCTLLYFTAIYGIILLNLENQHYFILGCNVRLSIRSWSCKLFWSCSYYLLCLLLSLIYCLMTLCLWESWRRNCLWKIYKRWIVLNNKLRGTTHSEEEIKKTVLNLVHLASVMFQKNKTRASNRYLSKNVL